MNWWQALILGIVEGITEFLPVSSTGHLIIASALVGLDHPEVKPAMDTFNIVIQGAAILAVAGLYWSRITQMVRGLLGRDPAGFRLLVNISLAFFPVAVVGVLLHSWIEARLFYPGPVIAALILGGLFMMWVDDWRAGRFSVPRPSARELDVDDLTPGRALIIGLLQCISVWPGTSRAMMTITAGYLVGLRPRQAAEFSFLLGLPVLVGATAYAMLKNILRNAGEGESVGSLISGAAVLALLMSGAAAVLLTVGVHWLVGSPRADAENVQGNAAQRRGRSPTLIAAGALSCLVGGLLTWLVCRVAAGVGDGNMIAVLGPGPVAIGIVATVVSAAAAVKWLVGFVGRHGLKPFGWYRIVMALAVLGLSLGGVVQIAPDDEPPPIGETVNAQHHAAQGPATANSPGTLGR